MRDMKVSEGASLNVMLPGDSLRVFPARGRGMSLPSAPARRISEAGRRHRA